MKSFIFSQLGSLILELPLLSFILFYFLLEYYLTSNDFNDTVSQVALVVAEDERVG